MQDTRAPFDLGIEQEIPEETAGARGWEGLAELTGLGVFYGSAATEAPELGLPDLVSYGGQTFTPALAEVTRGKEIAAPLERRASEQIVAEVSIIRHGVTQGYSADAGLTGMGAWQAHRRGHELARRVNPGERVRIVCAQTSRARQTADQLYRGITDGLVLFGIAAEVSEPEPIPAATKPSRPRLFLTAPSVLLVEDNDINALLARRMLEKVGCKVQHCINGREAAALEPGASILRLE